MSNSANPTSLDEACQEIEQLKSKVADLDRKLSQLRLPGSSGDSDKPRQSQSAFDALTGKLPKSRCVCCFINVTPATSTALYKCHGVLHTVTAEASSVSSVTKQQVLHNMVYRSTAALDRLNASTDLLNTEQVAMSTTRVVMHQIVLPSDTDSLGICFGGQVLGWIDVCAGLAAKTVAKGPCVTASVDAVHFLKPCRVVDYIVCNIPVLA